MNTFGVDDNAGLGRQTFTRVGGIGAALTPNLPKLPDSIYLTLLPQTRSLASRNSRYFYDGPFTHTLI